MSQFRKITTGIYFSQWNGDNLNTGTDPLLPKKDLTYWTTGNLTALLGCGWYEYTTANRSANMFFEGDGKVVYKLSASPSFISNLGSFAPRIIKLTLIDWPNFNQIGAHECVFNYQNPGLTFQMRTIGFVLGTDFTNTSLFRNVIIGNVLIGGGFSNRCEQNIFSIDSGSPTPNYTTSFASSNPFNKNYFSKETLCRINPLTSTANLVHFTNNLINGPILVPLIDAVQREAKLNWDGSTRSDTDPLLDDIVDVFPNFYSQGNYACSSDDLKFIDIVTRTVEQDSHLLKRGDSTLGYIGGVKVGRKIDLDESGFTITKTGIDDSNPNFWKIAVGVDYAKIRITGKVSDSLISAQTLDIRIPFNFDGDAVGGTADNNNVPDAWNARTALDTKGELPNRLTFEVRSSQLTNPGRDVSADWDNDNTNNPSIAGQYYLMEYGQAMLHHVVSAVAYGNADAAAINAATKLPFNYRSLDIIITITNTREI